MLETGKSVYVAPGAATGRAAAGVAARGAVGTATGAFPRSAVVIDPYNPEPDPTALKEHILVNITRINGTIMYL
jgi:hypothetical protein